MKDVSVNRAAKTKPDKQRAAHKSKAAQSRRVPPPPVAECADDLDTKMIQARLDEVAGNPSRVVGGDELKGRLAKTLRK